MARVGNPILPAAFLLLAAATPASATLDPQADCMGVYFDPGAEIVCGSASPFSQLSIYIVLTEGSAPNLSGWEAGLLWEPVGDAQFLGAWTVPGCLDIAGTDQDGQFQVGCGTRLLAEPAMVLAVWDGFYLGSPGSGALLTLGGLTGSTSFSDGYPGYFWMDDASGLHPQSCRLPVAGPSLPCAMLNVPGCGQLIVADEGIGWGDVKTLYRENRP